MLAKVDWEAVSRSEDWQLIIRPAIMELRDVAMNKLLKCTPGDPGIGMLQGQVLTYNEIVELPERLLATQRYIEQEEAKRRPKENGNADEPNWLRRAGARLRRSTSRSNT